METSSAARRTLGRWLRHGEVPAESVEVATAARDSGLAGLLDSAVADSWPAGEARDLLHHAHVQLTLRATHQLQLVAELVGRLAARGLRALPLKGAAVAETLYMSVGHRPMRDVDILVLDDWTASADVLHHAGFEVEEKADHAWAFADPRRRSLVELHHGLTSCPGLFPIDRDSLWERSWIRPHTQVQRVPAGEDLLVQLALHAAFQHGLDIAPVQYLDLRRLLEAPLDLDQVRRSALAARAERALALAVLAAEATVAAPVSGELRRVVDEWLPASERRLLQPLADGASAPAGSAGLIRARWAVAKGRRFSLLRDTLAPRRPGDATRPGALHIARRAIGLVRSGLAGGLS